MSPNSNRSPDAAPRGGSGLFRMHPDGTASRGSRIYGIVLLAAATLWLLTALVFSPADTGSENQMGDMVRIMYVHVPVANACYLSFLVTAIASVAYLWKRTEGWDVLAVASAEIGIVFTFLTLVTGSIWGHIAWGTWWEWEARLTSTLVLFLLYVGYLALRGSIVDPTVRAKRAAVLGIIAFFNVPIIHFSVNWWRGLHQDATVSRLDPTIDGLKLFSLVFGMLLAVAIYGWLMIHNFRLHHAAARAEVTGLDRAIEQRRAEGQPHDVLTEGSLT